MNTSTVQSVASSKHNELKTTQKSYDDFSEQYAQTWGKNWQSEDKVWIDEFLSHLPKKASIIDVGCGTGHVLQYCAANQFKVTGVDVSEGMLSQAKQQVPQAQLVQMNADSLSFPTNTFDGLISRYVLQHLNEVDQAIAECYRVLRPKGFAYLVIHVSNTETLDESWYSFPNNGGKIKMNYHAPTDVEHAIAATGFIVKKKTLVPDGQNRNYSFLLQKK
jgi:ubiquinone/menaquinone biosynthesis C-methylase UbiE